MANIYFEMMNSSICLSAKQPLSSVKSEKPSWWKNIPQYVHLDKDIPFLEHRSNATIKSCPAINDVFNFGYTIYLPYDIYIDASIDGQLNWYVPVIEDTGAVKDSNKMMHLVSAVAKDVLQTFNIPIGYHEFVIKLNTLWGIKTDPGYSVWITNPVNRYDLPLLAIDAIVDSDEFPIRDPISFFVKKGFCGVIKSGTPIIQVIPFKREKFSSEIVELDKKNYKMLFERIQGFFTNPYKKLMWHRKKFE